MLSCLRFCLRGEVQTTVQSNSVGYGWVVSSRVKITGSQRKVRKKTKEQQRTKGNCQSGARQICKDGAEKVRIFSKVAEQVLCSLVQVWIHWPSFSHQQNRQWFFKLSVLIFCLKEHFSCFAGTETLHFTALEGELQWGIMTAGSNIWSSGNDNNLTWIFALQAHPFSFRHAQKQQIIPFPHYVCSFLISGEPLWSISMDFQLQYCFQGLAPQDCCFTFCTAK